MDLWNLTTLLSRFRYSPVRVSKGCSELQSDNMPFWTSLDTRNALLSSIIPGGAVFASFVAFSNDKDTIKWYNGIRKPSWAPTDVRLYAAADILAIAPLGYASYLVYKNGGGFDYNDTCCALGLYGTNLAVALATFPIVKKKKLSCLWKNTLLLHSTALLSAFLFYKIDKTAGLLMLPYAAWTGFYAYLTYCTHKENNEEKNE